MNLTSTSHLKFDIFINNKLAFSNENIYFTIQYINKFYCEDLFEILKNMEVCTKINFNNLSVFKH